MRSAPALLAAALSASIRHHCSALGSAFRSTSASQNATHIWPVAGCGPVAWHSSAPVAREVPADSPSGGAGASAPSPAACRT